MDKKLIGHTIIENKTYAVGNDKKGLYLVKDNSIELIDPNFKICDNISYKRSGCICLP